jgi:hypothetical protein
MAALAGRDSADGSHHHCACSRSALVLGRTGAAPWSALRSTGPTAKQCSNSLLNAERSVILVSLLLSPASAARPPAGFRRLGCLWPQSRERPLAAMAKIRRVVYRL